MPEERKSTPDEQKHRQGVVLFNQGSYDQAARLFAEALDIQETSDCWNDWATAEMLCERGPSGERGFRYALDLNPHNQQAAANLGIFLAGLDRHAEAIALLEQPLEGVDQQQRDAIAQLLTNCREKLATGESADAGVPAEGQPEAHAEASEGPTSSPEDVEGSEGPRLNNASQPAAQAELAQPQNREQVIAAVNSVSKWWHTIELPFGLTTPGVIDYRNVVDKWGLPSDLTGKTVLDIGCWDGFWSFEAEKRGAKRVLAVDNWTENFLSNGEGFLVAHALLGSRVDYLWNDFFALSVEQHGRFDVVLFLGVLYHLRNPLLALERIAQLCNQQLILETLFDPTVNGCTMEFLEGDECNHDPTNWWRPSLDCLLAMLRFCGFSGVKPIYVRGDRVVITAFAPHLGSGVRQLLARFGEALVSEAYQMVVGKQPSEPLQESLAALPIEVFGQVKQKAAELKAAHQMQLNPPVPNSHRLE